LLESQIRDGVRYEPLSTRLDDRLVRWIRRLESALSKVAPKGRPDLFYRYYYFRGLYSRGYATAAARLMHSRGVDVAIVNNFSQFLPVLSRRCPNAKIGILMHCDWLVELPERRAGRRLRSADLVTGCSDFISGGIRRRFPDLKARVETLYNGSSPDALAKDCNAADAQPSDANPGDKVILFVGRITPEKGVHVLISAMEQILDRVPDARLDVLGPYASNPPSPRVFTGASALERSFEDQKPGYREELLGLAKPYGDRVRFISDLPHGQLGPHYQRADVFVHPALWEEPFGMILTEAMAFSCPVVSTLAGGVPEIVQDGETGLLVERGDVGALANAIVALLTDPARAGAMGEAGRRRLLANFVWDHTAQRLDDLLRPFEAASP
jgi:glycosyltransferase involved in cell wall biosynthesis